jgi:hypothetical protein
VLEVQFDASDAPIGAIDVSLTGTGLNPVGVADLEIYGTVTMGETPTAELAGLLWALDLEQVSLYGYSGGGTSYVLEAVGTILDCEAGQHFGVVGDQGVMRGHLDFFNAPPGWIPSFDQYDPGADVDEAIRAAYSGETGWVPEPASLILALVVAAVARRR